MARLKSIGSKVATVSLTRLMPTRQGYDKFRGSSNDRGYNYRWQQVRKDWLRKHPLCVTCQAKGLVTVATELDHIIPHRGDQNVFWDRNNWQGLCKPCHGAKTAAGM